MVRTCSLSTSVPSATVGRKRLPRTADLVGTAIAFTSLYLAAGALMPMLAFYREQWLLSAAELTLAFAVFAGGFLAALLTVGSLSDHVGRRPVLLSAMSIALVSDVIFLTAPDIRWVVIGRTVQGFATGAATPAFTAALVELAPPGRQKLGSALGSTALAGGLALGSLSAGLAIDVAHRATFATFIGLIIGNACGLAFVALSPETVTRTAGALRALRPRLLIPVTVRREFIAAAPVIAATWMLSGLTGGLAPSMVRTVFSIDSGLITGLSGSLAPAASAVVGLLCVRVDARRAMTLGIWAAITGATAIAGGAAASNLAITLAGQAISGVAFGAAFTAALELLIPHVERQQRSALAATAYVVAYAAFGAPVIISGYVVDHVGLVPTVIGYSTVAVLLAGCGLKAPRRA
jgi:MFS family permease